MTLDEFKKDPDGMLDDREKELKPYGGMENFESAGYAVSAVYDKPGIKWGMSIDLNSCIGCARLRGRLSCGEQRIGGRQG